MQRTAVERIRPPSFNESQHMVPLCSMSRQGAIRRIARAALLLALGFAAVGRAAAATSADPPGAFKAPYMPTTEDEVLQEVPSVADPAVAAIRSLRARYDAAPHDLAAALALADAYVDYGRQVGDAHYAGYAEALLMPWLRPERAGTGARRAAPGAARGAAEDAGAGAAAGAGGVAVGATAPANVLVTEATILQYRHEFDPARELLNRALQTDPRNAQAWLTLATLDMVQGDYGAAGKDCAHVTNSAGLEMGIACAGNLRSYVGQAQQSRRLLMQAEASAARLPASYQAWVQGLLAETAERLGDWPGAELHYRNALRLLPQDNFLLVAYADFLLDRGRAAEVLPLLAGHEQSDTAYLRIALAQAAQNSTDLQRYVWIMAARFEALRLRGSDYFGREQSRFALLLEHDPQTALEMAQRNWQVQKAPWDIRVLFEAALAANRPQAAAEVLEFYRRTRLEDPVIEPLAQKLTAQLKPAGAAR